jgi:hypothetical protein
LLTEGMIVEVPPATKPTLVVVVPPGAKVGLTFVPVGTVGVVYRLPAKAIILVAGGITVEVPPASEPIVIVVVPLGAKVGGAYPIPADEEAPGTKL